MRKKFVRGLAYVMCATLTITAVPPWAVYAESGTEVSGSKVATPSEASREIESEVEKPVNEEDVKGDLPDVEPEEILPADPDPIEVPTTEPVNIATPSEVVEPTFTDVKKALAASLLSSVPSSSSLGDIWDSWSGKTSFEFLNGSQGEGTEEKPYLIKNREQLMGLSELTAMGMMVPEAEGAKYAGDYSGCYFALGANIDLQGVDWIPIGFYQDSSEKTGEVSHTFNGFFDGNGKTIKNLKLASFAGYNNVGLFGSVSNASIHDLTIIPDSSSIKGNDRTGVVAGYAENSEIRNVTVKNADISSTGISGGIAGEISGTVIENATCEKVMIDAKGGSEIIYAGGIAGVASNSSIVDCEVSTGTGTTARIQGTGYIGGIVGYQNASNIFNTYVSGTIGGYHSTAIGGITGKYAAGKIKVARFAGTIGNSQLGSMAWE